MIAAVNGDVIAIGDDRLDVSIGPVALSVHVPSPVALSARVGQPVALATTMVVREDAITLYGFADATSRDDFVTLTSVSGIGPRLALAILSALSPAHLRAAINTGNLAALTAVSGVGKKSAERLVIELRDRLGPALPSDVPHQGDIDQPWEIHVRTALSGLGWSPRDVQSAIDAVAVMTFDNDTSAAGQSLQTLLRAALRSLDRS